MTNVWRIILLLTLLSCLAFGCSKSTRYEDVVPMPWAKEEAEFIALCLSGELVAPNDLYNQVLNDLKAIRSAFGDDFKLINRLAFTPPWIENCIIIGFDDTTAKKVANGEYHAWDELNKKYQVFTKDTTSVERYGYAILYFKDRLHPCRLAELYAVLPGVRHTGPNRLDGDWPNVYPRQTGNGITYLFRDAWGDCPSGCIHNEYWYFVFEENQPLFIGHWTRHENLQEPDWWDEAKQNIEQYRKW